MAEKNNKNPRNQLVSSIEEATSSRLICYILGDRGPFSTKIAEDSVKIFYKHLQKIGNVKKISLFLYTRGGDMLAPLRITKLIRDHCETFEVIIPYRAHSAGTLLALGADTILMSKLGELTPIDPTTSHPFNPDDPINPQAKMEISVEDVTSYFLLAKEKAGIQDGQMVEIFSQLVNKIHPLALGNIYRGHRMVRLLAKKLLSLHMKNNQKAKMEKIVNSLTQDLPIHGYLITRGEAMDDLGLKIEIPDEKLEANLINLLDNFSEELELGKPFDPLKILGEDDSKEFTSTGAIIQTEENMDKFIFKGIIKKVQSPDGKSTFDINLAPSWE